MKWITRERPKIDRIACPWLIKRFVDENAEFLYVPFEEVRTTADSMNAIPYDIPDVEYTHYGEECTFDYIIKKHKIDDEAVLAMSHIVRGADTDRHDVAVQSSGLWAISAGIAHNIKDDYELLAQGMVIYDGLYTWAKLLQNEKHTQHPFENLLLDVYKRFLTEKEKGKRVPKWANELRHIIQDQIDTNLTLNLKEISQSLHVHPTYLSREFSKYFDDLSFGDYIRKLRIDKSIELLKEPHYSLAEISYLTGFSDQSHFTRTLSKTYREKPGIISQAHDGKWRLMHGALLEEARLRA